MIFRSIRWRLQAWHGLILVAVLTGFGITAYQVARENQIRAIDQDLEQQMDTAIRFRPLGPPLGLPPGPPPEGGGPPPMAIPFPLDMAEIRSRTRAMVEAAGVLDNGQPSGFYFVLWEKGVQAAHSRGAPGDVPVPEEARTAVTVGERFMPPPGTRFPGVAHTRTRGSVRELYRMMPDGNCILVGRSIKPDQAAMYRLALWLTAAGAGILLLGLAGGGWVAARAIRPINEISATAQRIAAGDLSQRIDLADTESELGRLAGVLNSTFGRLEASFAQQARFTADASHELRTPVAVILSQAQTTLARERTPAEYRDALEACQRAAQRMKRLTESLLQLARLDAEEEPMAREPLDLARVARECADLVRTLAAERRIQVETDLGAAYCLGDPLHLSQLITNLLANSLQFNREGGSVRITTRMEGDRAVLRVADTGEGIPAEDLPHVFERFYRADKSRSRLQGRTGLGLAISKAIVDAHHGSIAVESEPGKGSTFIVTLPASAAGPREAACGPRPSPQTSA